MPFELFCGSLEYKQTSRPNLIASPSNGYVMVCRVDCRSGVITLLESVPLTRSRNRQQDINDILIEYRETEILKVQGMSADPKFRSSDSAQTCKDCHEREHTSWLGSKHAESVSVLRRQRKLTEQYLKCHSRYPFLAAHQSQEKDTQNSVSCVDCHGDTRKHSLTTLKKDIHRVPNAQVCTKCHNATTSPHFSF